ncbi:MAG: GreA/GreB family elongation factor [Mycobacterium leprae]
MTEEEKLEVRPPVKDVKRIRRETRSETAIGVNIERAASEANNRAFRALSGPPPTAAEQALIAASKHEPVRLFSRVLVADLDEGEQARYTIVPHGEGSLAAGRLEVGSPLARTFLAEYPGAVVRVKTPGGNRRYRILQVE